MPKTIAAEICRQINAATGSMYNEVYPQWFSTPACDREKMYRVETLDKCMVFLHSPSMDYRDILCYN